MTNTQHQIYFRAEYEIEAPDFWWTKRLEEFGLRSPGCFDLKLLALGDTDETDSISRWRKRVIFTQIVPVNHKIYGTFERLCKGPSFDDALRLSLFDTPIEGSKTLFSHAWIPEDFWPAIRSVHESLDRTAFKLLNNLFWRTGVHCGPSKLQSEYLELCYSIDEAQFDLLPIRWDLVAEFVKDEPPVDHVPSNFSQTVLSTEDAPVHHLLFRESWKSQESEHRVSIVMATAALESAIKSMISKLQPDTKWLLENTPSPPVVQMLREAVENLPVKCKFGGVAKRPPSRIITMVKEAVECRNKIVHGASCSMPSEGKLGEWLAAIRDVLWLTDYYCGHDWAMSYISADTVEELLANPSNQSGKA